MTTSATRTVFIVCGPTAVGKTAVAIALARAMQTEIISADSRQCYKELSIGVARPSPEELSAIPHHFIASHSITEEITAAGFEQYALKLTADLFRQYQSLVMVGGTGLYIRAFCEGLDRIPDVPVEIRNRIVGEYQRQGVSWLREQLREKDPAYFAVGETRNPQRMMRALEVWETTGQSILDFQKGEKVKRDFRICKLGLELPREELILHIDKRVDQMMELGLLEEVRSLLPFRHLNALQTVGYAELFQYLDGSLSLAGAVERIKINTRQYAKRQMTWFKKDPEITWFNPRAVEEILNYCRANS